MDDQSEGVRGYSEALVQTVDMATRQSSGGGNTRAVDSGNQNSLWRTEWQQSTPGDRV